MREILGIESRQTGRGDVGDDKSEPAPSEGGQRSNKSESVFNVINFVNCIMAAVFLSVGLVYILQDGQAYGANIGFGLGAYKRISIYLSLNGLALLVFSWLSLQSRKVLQNMIMHIMFGSIVSCTLLVASLTQIPDNQFLLRNVSGEMNASLAALRSGGLNQRLRWDIAQFTLKCCGLSSYWDWCEPNNGTQVGCKVPKSCFSNLSSEVPKSIHVDVDQFTPIFDRGCYPPIMNVLRMDLSILRFFTFFLNALMAFSTTFAAILVFEAYRADQRLG